MVSTNSGESYTKPAKKRRKTSVIRGLFTVGLMVGLFWLGLNVGNGTISIYSNEPVASNENLPDDLDYREVERLYDVLRENYDGDITVEELIEGLKSGLVEAAGDPYTEFFDQESAADFNDQLSGSFTGIGAELGKNENNNIIVVAPIKGFPAEKAGLRAQDIIVSVDGESTEGWAVEQAVSNIRGPEGTEVTLGIIRENEQLDLTITRAEINIPSVEYEIREDGVGYIQMRSFWSDTPRLAEQAAREFVSKDVEKIVLDLRGNPGGSLEASIEVAELWLKDGATILEERRDGKTVEVFRATGNGPLQGVETVVLIDQGSASASEIVAGALRDNDAATLVGQTSFGKGSVQQIISLPNGSQLKVTIARWYTPGGKNIDKEGIKPEREVEYTPEDAEADRDPQLDAAIEFLNR